MSQTDYVTLSQAIAFASEHGVTWQLRVRSRVEETNLRVSVTSADADAGIALQFGDRNEVHLGPPSQSGVDTRDVFYDAPLYRSDYFLVLTNHGERAEVRLLDAAQTFNRAFGEWTRLDELLRDPARQSEACVSYLALDDAFNRIDPRLPKLTPTSPSA